jgi:hypothetical protein
MAKKKKEPNIKRELRQVPVEPVLPIEKKLVGWSLALGAVLLVVLVWITRVLFP